jgi:hypothetical protein
MTRGLQANRLDLLQLCQMGKQLVEAHLVIGEAKRFTDRLTIGIQRERDMVSFPDVNSDVVHENLQTRIDSEATSGHYETFCLVRDTWLIHNQLIRNPS